MKQHGSLRFSTRNSAYLVVCSSGGVPATSVLGSEVVLSTVVPADPGDPAGEVAAVCTHVCVREGGEDSQISHKNLLLPHTWMTFHLLLSVLTFPTCICLPWSDALWVNVQQQMAM